MSNQQATELREVVELVCGVPVPVSAPLPRVDALNEAAKRNVLEAFMPADVRCQYSTRVVAV